MGRAPFQVLVLPFRLEAAREAEFAVLRRADDAHWQGIAGGGEDDETIAQAARREALEEAGVPPEAAFYRLKMQDFVPVSCFPAATEWPQDTYVVPQYFFACDATGLELVVSAEHTELAWLSYDDAYERLRYDSNRTALWELAQRLSRDLGPRLSGSGHHTPPAPDDRVVSFYTAECDESVRLSRSKNRLEFLRTQELLRDRLPAAPARILDVGGGTGVHAAWLAADAYDVDVVDIVPEHVGAAREFSARLGDTFSAHIGDARSLEAADASVDACLLLGPLYHLPDPSDRAAALTEAARVTRPGGLVCAAAISRYAWPLYGLRDGSLSAERAASIAETLDSGHGAPVGSLPAAFSHRVSDLAAELADAGLVEVEVLGIEGPAWTLFTPDLADDRVEGLLDAAIRAARLYDSHADMTAASAHLLACGRRDWGKEADRQ